MTLEIVFFALFSIANGFLTDLLPSSSSRTVHSAFLDDVGKFFQGVSGSPPPSDGPYTGSMRSVASSKAEEEGLYVGSKRIMTIEAKTMKQGGLRLYCNLYLMGLQNTPEDGSWKASKSDNSEVNLRYKDLSGSIIIRFEDEGITVDRLGSSPSMAYLAAESMILNGFIDELKAIIYDGEIAEENRLLTLEDRSILEAARGEVSFL